MKRKIPPVVSRVNEETKTVGEFEQLAAPVESATAAQHNHFGYLCLNKPAQCMLPEE